MAENRSGEEGNDLEMIVEEPDEDHGQVKVSRMTSLMSSRSMTDLITHPISLQKGSGRDLNYITSPSGKEIVRTKKVAERKAKAEPRAATFVEKKKPKKGKEVGSEIFV